MCFAAWREILFLHTGSMLVALGSLASTSMLTRWTSVICAIVVQYLQDVRQICSAIVMCGRAYETYTDEELFARYLNEKAKRGNPLAKARQSKANYNLS